VIRKYVTHVAAGLALAAGLCATACGDDQKPTTPTPAPTPTPTAPRLTAPVADTN